MQKGIKLHQLTSSKTSAILLTNSSGRCLKVGTLKQKEETDQVTSVLCRVQDTPQLRRPAAYFLAILSNRLLIK